MRNQELLKEELTLKGIEVRSITSEVERMFCIAESKGFKGVLAEQYVAQQLYYLNERLKLQD